MLTPVRLVLLLLLLSLLLFCCTQQEEMDDICDGERKSLDAIVILGQKKHSTYDSVTHPTSLHPILSSLVRNYPRGKEADILIFQEGDLFRTDLIEMDGFNLRLCLLQKNTKHWGDPPHWPSNGSKTAGLYTSVQWSGIWSRGYHYMIRFYAITIWTLLDELGYQWMMRFDDDSKILSPIDYNMFDAMRDQNKIYGFRMYRCVFVCASCELTMKETSSSTFITLLYSLFRSIFPIIIII